MRTKEILSAGITGTTLMTLFSYLVSESSNKNFKEPDLLAKMCHRLLPGHAQKLTQIIGWSGHYAVGVLFAMVYVQLWEERKVRPTLRNGLLLGAVSGAFAIVIWKLTFKIHPNPPKNNRKGFYSQLFFAHVLFGMFATIGYKLIHNEPVQIQAAA